MSFACAGGAAAQFVRDDNPLRNAYRVDVGVDPTNPDDASTSLPARKAAVIKGAACQDEPNFWSAVWSARGARGRGEGMDFAVIAKEGLLLANTSDFMTAPAKTACSETVTTSLWALGMPETDAIAKNATGLLTGDPNTDLSIIIGKLIGKEPEIDTALRKHFEDAFPSKIASDPCFGALKTVKLLGSDEKDAIDAFKAKPEDRGRFIHIQVEYQLSLKCVQAQINIALKLKEVTGRAGSSELPCFFDGDRQGLGVDDPDGKPFFTTGEWDVDMRDLMRILYLNNASADMRAGRAAWLLDPPTVDHIRNDLIILNTFVGQDTYSPVQCGNQEQAQGDALERLSERDWTDRALDSIGDFFKWLLRRLLVVVLIVLAVVGLLLLFPYLVLPVVVAAGALAAVATLGQIPETENHRLMIETSRYLHNQLLIADLKRDHPDEDLSTLEDDQKDVRKWLMEKFRDLYHDDFSEYNARPYGRYSLLALLNIADFAGDADLRTAARMVLTTTMAKAALASNDGVRYVPFRRRPSSMNAAFFCHGVEKYDCPSTTDFGGAADHMMADLSYFSGQTPQKGGKLSIGAADELAFEATSGYEPPKVVLALAISDAQTLPRWQVRRHEVPEVTYSERAFLVTAGGIDAGAANKLNVGILGVAFSTGLFGHRDDSGTAVPTVLQFRVRQHRADEPPTTPVRPGIDNTILANLIRIYGDPDFDKNHSWVNGMPLWAEDATPMFDDNLCVYKGFACGVNLVVPDAIVPCLKADPRIPGLSYLDTTACDATKDVEPSYVAIFRAPCDDDADDADHCDNMGFFQAMAATQPNSGGWISFAAFQSRVRTRNSSKWGTGFACRDRYVSATDEDVGIDYRCDSEHAIRAVGNKAAKDYTDEERAKGNVIVRTGDGYIHTIWWPEKNQSITLDWSDADKPVHP